MKQVFYHYTEWEDFQSGMYNEVKEGREERIQKAVEMLSNESLCYKCMTTVATEWKKATEQTFTNKSINHQAYLGQCACNVYAGVKEDETREAWGRLTNEQRYRANKVADLVRDEWEQRYLSEIGEGQLSFWRCGT